MASDTFDEIIGKALMHSHDGGDIGSGTINGAYLPPGGGASTALDNLASVAINTSLLSDSNGVDDLGSPTKQWKRLYVSDSWTIGGDATFTRLAAAHFGTTSNIRVSGGGQIDINSEGRLGVNGYAAGSSITCGKFPGESAAKFIVREATSGQDGLLANDGVSIFYGAEGAIPMSLRSNQKSHLVVFPNGNIKLGWDVLNPLTAPVPIHNLEIAQTKFAYGTVSNSAGGTTVTGVGTQFLNTFKVGDSIKIPYNSGQTVDITAIASDTSMTTAAITNANANSTYEVMSGGIRFGVKGNGGITVLKQIITPGTTGSQTMNTVSGRVNIAALGTTVTVTNSLVTTNSIIVATAATNDATGVVRNVVAAAGSFTINCDATTAETAINWIILN